MNAAQLLRDWGFDLSVTDDNKILISPFSKLEPELVDWIKRNRAKLIVDIQSTDEVSAETENLLGVESDSFKMQRWDI